MLVLSISIERTFPHITLSGDDIWSLRHLNEWKYPIAQYEGSADMQKMVLQIRACWLLFLFGQHF